MISLAENSSFSFPASEQDGEGGGTFAVYVLDSAIYQTPRWCPNCGGEQIFVEMFECEAGRYGVCLGCGEEKLVRFSRAMEEG